MSTSDQLVMILVSVLLEMKSEKMIYTPLLGDEHESGNRCTTYYGKAE